ncbi:MAG: hypothetical protein E3K32_02920 [wastewater metagenome]|nr:hypothetical protein [Candidatus Loosdrechtia aerotolerans]
MKQKLKTVIIISMAVLIAIIAIHTLMGVSGSFEQMGGSNLAWRCFALWIRSIILTQAVLVVGGLLLFMLRKPKETS